MTGTYGSLRGFCREADSISSGTLYLMFALFSGLLGTAFSVLVRMELSGPGVQYIAGALFNLRYKSGDSVSISYCQHLLNLLTHLTTKEVGDRSMSVNPYLSVANQSDESGEVYAFYALKLLTIAGLYVSIGTRLARALD